MSAKSAYQRWHEWRLRVVSDSDQHENMKQRQREQKRKERADFKEKASNAQLEAKRAADRERQRRRRARLRAAREMETIPDVTPPIHVGAGSKTSMEPNPSVGRVIKANSHSKSSRSPMKISVNGLISTKRGQRFPDGDNDPKERHPQNGLNGHGNLQPGKMGPTGLDAIKKLSPVADFQYTGGLLMTVNNNVPIPVPYTPSRSQRSNPLPMQSSHPITSKAQSHPEQEQPLCLKKTAPKISNLVDRDFKRTLLSPSDHLKKSQSYSPSCWDDLNLSSRKRSRKQSQPLKYVALH